MRAAVTCQTLFSERRQAIVSIAINQSTRTNAVSASNAIPVITETKWSRLKPYDHGKTKFALEGAHKNVDCATCHVGEIYKDLARTCVSCHRLQDVHSDRYGPKCEACHDQSKWKNVRFDHDKTKYPLRGAHKKVKCDACHTGDIYREKLAMTCVSCHKKQDPHKNELGPRCEQCHNENNWRQKAGFDHDLTRFPLIGTACSGALRRMSSVVDV